MIPAWIVPNKTNKYTKRYSICEFYVTKANKNGPKETWTSPPRKKEKHLYDISLERHHSAFPSTDRNSTPHGARSPHEPFKSTLRNRCLPRTSDSARHQPEPRPLAKRATSALRSETRCGETGSTTNGYKILPTPWIPGPERSQWKILWIPIYRVFINFARWKEKSVREL